MSYPVNAVIAEVQQLGVKTARTGFVNRTGFITRLVKIIAKASYCKKQVCPHSNTAVVSHQSVMRVKCVKFSSRIVTAVL